MTDLSNNRRLGYTFVIASSLLWSTNGLFSRLIFDSGTIEPRQLAAIRIYGAALLLAPIVIANRPRLSRSDLVRVLGFGVFGVSLPQWLYFEAIARIPVPIALVIVYLAPVIVTAWERFTRHTTLHFTVYASIIVAVLGVIFAVTGGKGGTGALAVSGLLLAFVQGVLYLSEGQSVAEGVVDATFEGDVFREQRNRLKLRDQRLDLRGQRVHRGTG